MDASKNKKSREFSPISAARHPIQADMSFLLWSIILVLLGQVMTTLFLISASAEKIDLLTRRALFVMIGVLLLWMFSKLDIWVVRRIIPVFYVSALLINILYCLDLHGPFIASAGHYLRFGGMITIETTQLLILAVCLMMARVLSAKQSPVTSVMTLGVVVVPLLLLMVSYRMDGMGILLLLAMALLFLRLKPSVFIFIGMVVVVVAFLFFEEIASSSAIEAWLDPFSDPLGSGYITIQSIYAIASGGTFGAGVDSDIAARLLGNDETYILSGVIHQFGIIAAVMACIAFILFFLAASKIILNAPDRHCFYLSAAIVIRFGVMAAVNFRVICNLIPEINCYLPFFCGSANFLFFDCVLVGVLLNISRMERQG